MSNDAEAVLIDRDTAHLIHPLHNPAAHAAGKVWAGGEGAFLVTRISPKRYSCLD